MVLSPGNLSSFYKYVLYIVVLSSKHVPPFLASLQVACYSSSPSSDVSEL